MNKIIGTICGLLTCQLLYWLAGAPYERGWSLWGGMGIGSLLFGIIGFALGMATQNKRKNHDDVL